MRKSYGRKWKQQAESKIYSAEVVIIYDTASCSESENTQWEIEKAKELGKHIVSLSREEISTRKIGVLTSAYDFRSEFEECFSNPGSHQDTLELYKIMVASSEQLIQRRQITNGFFITIIGAIVGASGFVIKEKIVTDSTVLVLILPIVIGLLMCRSWRNLIQNYGRLNTGKFKVIHMLEQQMGAKIFAAEWIALGKGLRKEKYQSFTSTEQNVPNLFSYLLWIILAFTLFSTNWEDISEKFKNSWASTGEFIGQSYMSISTHLVGEADNNSTNPPVESPMGEPGGTK